MDKIISLAKRRGFVFPGSDIYGGLANSWDYGPLGVELKNNIKKEWWNFHVHSREDVVGIDGSIITNPRVWKASGHVDNFADMMLVCTKCKTKIRADHFIEDKLKIAADGLKAGEINILVKEKGLKCPQCKSDFKEVNDFNLMFQTNVGSEVDQNNTAYLRPETAQLIFPNYKFIRSTELVFVAYKKGIINIHGKNVLDALLYATKFKGSSISFEEIEELKKV